MPIQLPVQAVHVHGIVTWQIYNHIFMLLHKHKKEQISWLYLM